MDRDNDPTELRVFLYACCTMFTSASAEVCPQMIVPSSFLHPHSVLAGAAANRKDSHVTAISTQPHVTKESKTSFKCDCKEKGQNTYRAAVISSTVMLIPSPLQNLEQFVTFTKNLYDFCLESRHESLCVQLKIRVKILLVHGLPLGGQLGQEILITTQQRKVREASPAAALKSPLSHWLTILSFLTNKCLKDIITSSVLCNSSMEHKRKGTISLTSSILP